MRSRTDRPPSSCFHFSFALSGSVPSTFHCPFGRAARAGRSAVRGGRAGGVLPSVASGAVGACVIGVPRVLVGGGDARRRALSEGAASG
ncbi:Uncharacterised protein [Mycobacteroides abscessus]|nr:Uncharacterised protein [Mycobacteroides abscessus]